MGLSRPFKALQGPSTLSKAFQSPSLPLWALPGSGPLWALLGPSRPSKALLGFPRPFKALVGPSNPFKAVRGVRGIPGHGLELWHVFGLSGDDTYHCAVPVHGFALSIKPPLSQPGDTHGHMARSVACEASLLACCCQRSATGTRACRAGQPGPELPAFADISRRNPKPDPGVASVHDLCLFFYGLLPSAPR